MIISNKIKDNDITKYFRLFDFILDNKSKKVLKRKLSLDSLLESINSKITLHIKPDSDYKFVSTKENGSNVLEINKIDIEFKSNNKIELILYMKLIDTYYGNILKSLIVIDKNNKFVPIKPRIKWNIVRYFELNLNIFNK